MNDDRYLDASLLPRAALDDYGEYLRRGGRFPLETWWERYKDDYVREAAS